MLARPAARAALCVLLALAAAATASSATTVTLTVQEPSGVDRVNDPVTSGVPIAPEDTSNTAWTLFEGSREIPLQTKVLFGIHNPWLLLDFRASVPAGATKTYTLVSQAPRVTASPTLKIDDTAPGSITVITGPLKVVIGKSPFNLFNEVWLDRNHDGVFDGAASSTERLVKSTSSDNLPLVLAGGIGRRGRRAPLRWSWEDRGPLRATLRVDGYYGDPGVVSDTLLYFTDRITFHAGQTYVTVDHLIRNSFRASERYVKVQSARLLVPGSSPSAGRIRRSGDRVWLLGRRGASFEMIPDSLDYTTRYSLDDSRTQKTMSVGSNGGMVIPDWSYHGAHVRFDFADTSLSTGEQTRRRTRYIDRLAALAPASWYSDRGAFGSEHFGTWEDEKNAYRLWGWRWPNTTPSPITNVDFTCYSAEHALPRPDWNYYPSWSSLSADQTLEEDDLWAILLMYGRVGQRTYLDRADRWERYFAWEYAYRTDGFAHQDRGFCDTLVRARNNLPIGVVFTRADDDFIRINTQDVYSRGRIEAGHMWNGGLVDYYYLTGDRDALAAALDIAEQTKQYTGCVGIDSLVGGAVVRFYARSYLNLLRAWEATGSSVWRLSANRLKAMFFHSLRYDPRGFYYAQNPPHYPGGKFVCSFQEGLVSQALYRDWVLTANGSTTDSLAVLLRTLARFAYQYGANRDTTFTGDAIMLDYPSPGNVLQLSTNMLRDKRLPWESTPGYSNSFVDALTIGYRLGGPACYLTKARKLWERATKYVMWVNGRVYRIADQSHVGKFAHTLQCGDKIAPHQQDLPTVQFFFHDAAWISSGDCPPATVSSLSAVAGYNRAAIRWSAPAMGAASRATAYDLRYSTKPITPASFASATPILTPAPAPAGSPQCAERSGLIPCTTYWFALRARDESGAWTALSNVAAVATDCRPGRPGVSCDAPLSAPSPTESDDPTAPPTVEFALAGANPVLGPGTVAFGIPASMAGQRLEISIFDLAGRRVQTLQDGVARPGRFRVQWNERSAIPGGAYFLVMRLGQERRASKVILIH